MDFRFVIRVPFDARTAGIMGPSQYFIPLPDAHDPRQPNTHYSRLIPAKETSGRIDFEGLWGAPLERARRTTLSGARYRVTARDQAAAAPARRGDERRIAVEERPFTIQRTSPGRREGRKVCGVSVLTVGTASVTVATIGPSATLDVTVKP
jgi:hypothetical protein